MPAGFVPLKNGTAATPAEPGDARGLTPCQRRGIRYPPRMTFPLTAYIEAALELARYDKLEDGSFAGEIPKLKGVIAFGTTLRRCEAELRSTLEDWLLVG